MIHIYTNLTKILRIDVFNPPPKGSNNLLKKKKNPTALLIFNVWTKCIQIASRWPQSTAETYSTCQGLKALHHPWLTYQKVLEQAQFFIRLCFTISKLLISLSPLFHRPRPVKNTFQVFYEILLSSTEIPLPKKDRKQCDISPTEYS